MLVLISHAVEDEPAAAALKEMIRRCSLNKIEVWFSSDRTAVGGMPMGGPWFNELSNKLKGNRLDRCPRDTTKHCESLAIFRMWFWRLQPHP
jgi:hypothetical protein